MGKIETTLSDILFYTDYILSTCCVIYTIVWTYRQRFPILVRFWIAVALVGFFLWSTALVVSTLFCSTYVYNIFLGCGFAIQVIVVLFFDMEVLTRFSALSASWLTPTAISRLRVVIISIELCLCIPWVIGLFSKAAMPQYEYFAAAAGSFCIFYDNVQSFWLIVSLKKFKAFRLTRKEEKMVAFLTSLTIGISALDMAGFVLGVIHISGVYLSPTSGVSLMASMSYFVSGPHSCLLVFQFHTMRQLAMSRRRSIQTPLDPAAIPIENFSDTLPYTAQKKKNPTDTCVD
ncbi:hypothetical protein HDV03_004677 [Kappamyces sp. JEL0829]|nr:hypothetical protein HDV03_004677 [Kappamyces sp. JEL0829]